MVGPPKWSKQVGVTKTVKISKQDFCTFLTFQNNHEKFGLTYTAELGKIPSKKVWLQVKGVLNTSTEAGGFLQTKQFIKVFYN